MSRSAIPARLREQVRIRDRERCAFCHLSQLGSASTFHIDHITPRSRGGATALDNLAFQCPSCSLHKADKVSAIDPVTAETIPLFHPLRQRWADHFDLLFDGACIGRTPTGRATVEALGMNLRIPRFARACQLALGLIAP